MGALFSALVTAAVGVFVSLMTLAPSVLAYEAGDLVVRIVDTGGGLCTVTKAPGGGYMVYDSGHWTGKHCLRAVEQTIPAGETIDLFVASHADSDHIG